MPDNKAEPCSLMARQATGGEVADHGFKFQAGMMLAQLPTWLAQSGFSQVISEALGDVEVRFFDPGKGECREFYEYKDHRLTPSEFWPGIDRFLELERSYPSVYRGYWLVCTDVNEELRAICRMLNRLRKALPFYDGVSTIEDESFNEFAERIGTNGRRNRAYARFVFNKVHLEYEAPRSAKYVSALFHDRLRREISECEALSGTQTNAMQNALSALFGSKVAEPINRSEVAKTIREAVPEVGFPTLDRTRLLTTSEPQSTWKTLPALVLDWAKLSGRGARSYPNSEIYNQELYKLIEAQEWIISSGSPRTIHLSGTRRLSASVAIGVVFSATRGFTIEIENRGDLLRTDKHPSTETPSYEWRAKYGISVQSNEVAILVSVKREIIGDVRRFLAGSCPIALTLYSSSAMICSDQMNLAVECLKEKLSEAISKTGAKKVHLFLAVPGPFAVFLGHRLNATCIIQCYEHTGGAKYVSTFQLDCS